VIFPKKQKNYRRELGIGELASPSYSWGGHGGMEEVLGGTTVEMIMGWISGRREKRRIF
jgi:hypothetical protein